MKQKRRNIETNEENESNKYFVAYSSLDAVPDARILSLKHQWRNYHPHPPLSN